MEFKINVQSASILFGGFIVALILVVPHHSLQAHSWKAPESAAKIANPVPLNSESIALGKESYEEACLTCHGKNAGGGNPADFEGKMTPPNLVERLTHHTDGDFFWKIQNGKGEMPAFKEDLNPDEIWNIINFIKSVDE